MSVRSARTKGLRSSCGRTRSTLVTEYPCSSRSDRQARPSFPLPPVSTTWVMIAPSLAGGPAASGGPLISADGQRREDHEDPYQPHDALPQVPLDRATEGQRAHRVDDIVDRLCVAHRTHPPPHTPAPHTPRPNHLVP